MIFKLYFELKKFNPDVIIVHQKKPFGIVLLEAAIAKKFIVCSDASGPKEIWNNTDATKMFARGNAKMLADKLAETIAEQDQAQNMAEKAYLHVKKFYSMPVVTNILQEALIKVTKDKK